MVQAPNRIAKRRYCAATFQSGGLGSQASRHPDFQRLDSGLCSFFAEATSSMGNVGIFGIFGLALGPRLPPRYPGYVIRTRKRGARQFFSLSKLAVGALSILRTRPAAVFGAPAGRSAHLSASHRPSNTSSRAISPVGLGKAKARPVPATRASRDQPARSHGTTNRQKLPGFLRPCPTF